MVFTAIAEHKKILLVVFLTIQSQPKYKTADTNSARDDYGLKKNKFLPLAGQDTVRFPKGKRKESWITVQAVTPEQKFFRVDKCQLSTPRPKTPKATVFSCTGHQCNVYGFLNPNV
jgi:hypothetical protein